MKSQIKADLMLLLVTMLWGTSYLLTDFTLEELDPFNINALRFIIAFFSALNCNNKLNYSPYLDQSLLLKSID
jgi:drug/metabolite transporter (DMT)-like permease